MDNGVLLEGTTSDVSMGGVRVRCHRCLPVGHRVRVSLQVECDDGVAGRVCATGVVRRADAQGIAIQFEGVDAEGLPALEHLVLTNSAPPVQREYAGAMVSQFFPAW